MRPDHFSFSQLSLLSECERKYFYRYVLGMTDPSGEAADVGTVYHHLMEKLPRESWSDRARVARALGQAWRDQGLDGPPPIDEVLRNLARADACLPLFQPDDLTELTLDWAGWRMVIDRLMLRPGRRPFLLDYKTVSGRRRRSQRDANYSPQLALYACAIADRYPIESAEGVDGAFFELPRSGGRVERLLPVRWLPKHLARWRAWFDEQLDAHKCRPDRIEAFPRCAPSNPLCSPMWCSFWSNCYGGQPVYPYDQHADHEEVSGISAVPANEDIK